MRLYHLSHIDLDGFSAQLLSTYFFQKYHFYNSNYGEEILIRVDSIFEDIKHHNEEEILVLITDVNLTIEQCGYIENKLYDTNNVKLQLLDHHITGSESAKAYDWYHLDDTKSATKITYEYLLKHFTPHSDISSLDKFVQGVNAADIWLEGDELFEFGKVCMQMISKTYEVPRDMFGAYDTLYKHAILKKAMEFLPSNDYIGLDEQVYFLKKEYLNIRNVKDTFENIASEYILSLIKENEDKFCLEIGGKKAIVSFKLSHISILANHYLKANEHIDFFINVSAKGHVSLRSNNKADVSKISQKCFDGGGHKNASGGTIKGFKNSFHYSDIKKQVATILA